MALLEIKDLNVGFDTPDGEVKAVNQLNFSIEAGDTLAIVGESGSGKTQAVMSIMGLLADNGHASGQALFKGEDLLQMSTAELNTHRGKEIAMIFQDPMESLNSRHSVEEILTEPFAIHKIGNHQSRQQEVRKLLDTVGLPTTSLSRYPFEFSGGQRQRIGIARALSLKPKLIVCDEAVSALDVSIQSQIINLLLDLQREFNLSYLFIAHDLAVVKHISDRVAVMYLGQIVETAKSEDIYQGPLHPYTRSLIDSIPVPDPRHKPRGKLLHGEVPSAINPPSGCRFHTRCPLVFDHCSQQAPQMHKRGDHFAACHLLQQTNNE